MAFTKEGIALLILTMTQWWTSTTVHVSGDESVKDQMHVLPDGRMECNFADRMILIANHQVNSPLSKQSSLSIISSSTLYHFPFSKTRVNLRCMTAN